MRVVGSAAGINIQAPEDAYFSYYNSPYIGHDAGTAIDIYPRHQEWGESIVSPVQGKIVQIRKMRMGQPKQFPTHDVDYGIGILPEGSEGDIVRVMHCEPSVLEGETVNLGDQIGKTIRSRYFNYWTGPHYHVEVLPQDSFQRSSKSYSLELDYLFDSKTPTAFPERIEFLAGQVTEDFAIGYAEGLGVGSISNLKGLPAVNENADSVGLLDGGLSHYKHGGVIGAVDLRPGTIIQLLSSPVGVVTKQKTGATHFERGPSVSAYLDDTELRGLSCFIYPHHFTKNGIPQLILIPKIYGKFKGLFDEGDVCELRMTSNNNIVKAD